MPGLELIEKWPGKSAGDDGVEHPAVYHMLDVAAVAELLIAPFDLPAALRDALVFLVALHDIGKVGAEFKAALRSNIPQGKRHWEVSEAHLLANTSLPQILKVDEPPVIQQLVAATAGHHGRPPNAGRDDLVGMNKRAGAEAMADATAIIKAFAALWPDAGLEGISTEQAKNLSWWMSGLTVAADWVGSNRDWFLPHPPTLLAADYLVVARQRARKAVDAAGLAPLSPGKEPLFDFSLRPMQQAAAEIALPAGPMLAIIEDETGAGKTEAAAILALRMLQAGKGRGLYFALPTMATADAMFSRARDFAKRFFTGAPTLALAHGRAGLSADFMEIVGGENESEDDISCAPWLADNRRKSLLAHIGIGTIDQALLAVLPTKFSTLRQFALSSKILIVDEAHELGDPYMQEELKSLLEVHASHGGSAILLTATLPLNLRHTFIEAFEKGTGPLNLRHTFIEAFEKGTGSEIIKDDDRAYSSHRDDDWAYPSLRIANGAVYSDFDQRLSAKGPVVVRRLDGEDEAVELLVESVSRGAACIWVRNAVDDVIAAVEKLRARNVDVELLHARFALCDRKAVEAQMLKIFGKNGEKRRPCVLVGTQVLEASLDLDADVMVSDLAPMAALIQRLGRQWRHMNIRPKETRPVDGPVLYVVSPDPENISDDKWLHGVLGSGAFVYPVVTQWRTASVLFSEGEIVQPMGVRRLIEAVHGDDAKTVPEVLEEAELKQFGEDGARANHGERNVVKFHEGYRSSGGNDDSVFPTRLGFLQKTLVLARRREGRLVAWAGGEGVEAWMLSEVQASAAKLDCLPLPDQNLPEIAAATAHWKEWKKKAVSVCVVEEDGTICEGLCYDRKHGLIFGSLPARG